MRILFIAMFLSLMSLNAVAQASGPPAFSDEVFVTMNYQVWGDANWDNVVLEDINGNQHTITFDGQAPVPGLSFEPYSGNVFSEGDYYYESLILDFGTGAITGTSMHHPIPAGGNPGAYTYFHSPMLTRYFRLDGVPFRVKSIDYYDMYLTGFLCGTGTNHLSWGFFPVTIGSPTWLTRTFPLLMDSAAGTIGQSSGLPPQDILFIDGSSGDSERRADVPALQPFSLSINQPAAYASPVEYFLFMKLGVPFPSEELLMPLGMGSMLFAPCPLQPPGSQTSFLLAATSLLPACSRVLLGFPGSMLWSLPGLPAPLQGTIQGVAVDNSNPAAPVFEVTNAIVLRIL